MFTALIVVVTWLEVLTEGKSVQMSAQTKEEQIPPDKQLCECEHSLERHYRVGGHSANMLCKGTVEFSCPCSKFTLYRVE